MSDVTGAIDRETRGPEKLGEPVMTIGAHSTGAESTDAPG
jgi:hypothetical protein